MIGKQVYGDKNVRVDKIFGRVFRKIFSKSIAKFKPRPGIVGLFFNLIYRIIRDNMPKRWFDFMTKSGAYLNMRSMGIDYSDILYANRIESQNYKQNSDNLLLVTVKQ